MTFRIFTLCMLSLFALFPPFTLADTFKWPGGHRAAVSLSYDDALDSQLDNAVPALKKYGVKASFYVLPSSPVTNDRLDEWRAVAAAGHELGNHSMFHACSAKGPNREWVPVFNDLDKRVVDQMVMEITTANTFLKAIDGRSERTLTPPCLDTQAADGNYIDAVRKQFVAVRSAEINLPEGFSYYLMPSGVSGKELISFVEQARKAGGMANIIFHGIGGDHLSVEPKAHAELLAYLAKNSDIYWTDTYISIMKYVAKSGYKQY